MPHGDSEHYYSLMSEVSYSHYKHVNKKDIVEETVQGLIHSGMITQDDTDRIVSRYVLDVPYTYPVPSLSRDHALKEIQRYLETHGVFSRGRFGGWKYEVGNMDHSTMQGVEIVDRIVLNKKEETYLL